MKNRGFSVIEIMLVLGVISIIGLALANLTTSSMKSQVKAEVLTDLNSKLSQLKIILGNSESCKIMLQDHITGGRWNELNIEKGVDLSENAPLKIKDKEIIKIGERYGRIKFDNLNLRILSMRSPAQNPGGLTDYEAQLRVSTSNTDEQSLGKTGFRNESFNLIASVDNQRRLQACYVAGYSNEELRQNCELLGGQFSINEQTQTPVCSALDESKRKIAEQIKKLNEHIERTEEGMINLTGQLRKEAQTISELTSQLADRTNNTAQNVNQIRNRLTASVDRIELLSTKLDDTKTNIDKQMREIVNMEQASQTQASRTRDVQTRADQNEMRRTATDDAFNRYRDDTFQKIENLKNKINEAERMEEQLETIVNNFTMNMCPFGRDQWGNCYVPNNQCVRMGAADNCDTSGGGFVGGDAGGDGGGGGGGDGGGGGGE
jgi:prepilin-type N-terminal cleavage/methylation domain-containing protein